MPSFKDTYNIHLFVNIFVFILNQVESIVSVYLRGTTDLFLPSSSSLLFLNQQNIINILIIQTMSKTINIDVPEGFEIDTEESNLSEGKIVFKRKEETPWRHTSHTIIGYYIESDSRIAKVTSATGCNNQRASDQNVFATEKQAKSALAMAQLSQIIQNDKRFGGPITDVEWKDGDMAKYVIVRLSNEIICDYFMNRYHFLAFHTQEQRNLFLKENEDLIRQYYML